MTAFPSTLPPSRIPDPAAAPVLRWGILAPGGIAASFVSALQAHTRQTVVAVGSRSTARADAFARRFGIERAHGSYAALVDDPQVDVVYVASPHSEHRAHALAAIAAGKHVLVEKSFARSAAEAREIADAAAASGVAVMEAMWTRFLPQTDVLRQLLADGVLGDVTTVLADHGQFFRDLDPSHRLLNPDLAGGALLDLGIYPVSFAHFALGRPERIAASGVRAETGVDAQVSAILERGDAHAVVNTTLLSKTPTTASVAGSLARAELSGPFYAPGTLTVTPVGPGAPPLTRGPGTIRGSGGLCYEAAELARCVQRGDRQSALLPLEETVAIMATMDEIRRQI